MSFLPSAEDVKKFVIGVLVPLAVGAATTWAASSEVLGILNVSTTTVAGVVTAAVTFAVGAVIAFLHNHHVLRGNI